MTVRPPWLLADCSPFRQWDRIPIEDLFRYLSIDKHFPPLARYNLSRAVATNMRIMSIDLMPINDECCFVLGDIELFPYIPDGVPPSLEPTALQLSQPHVLWIDLFPCPLFRDHLIEAFKASDMIEFLCDAAGRLEHECAGAQTPLPPGTLAWSDPWSPRGWEFTEVFVNKWHYLFGGCEELLEATNYWRSLRDEAPISITH
jgi:hypothetical protein